MAGSPSPYNPIGNRYMDLKDYMYKKLYNHTKYNKFIWNLSLAVYNCALNIYWFSHIPPPLLPAFWFLYCPPTLRRIGPCCQWFQLAKPLLQSGLQCGSMINYSKEPLDVRIVNNPRPNKSSTSHCPHHYSRVSRLTDAKFSSSAYTGSRMDAKFSKLTVYTSAAVARSPPMH